MADQKHKNGRLGESGHEGRQTIYIDPTTGKFAHEVDTVSITNCEEFKPMEMECDKKKRRRTKWRMGRETSWQIMGYPKQIPFKNDHNDLQR